MPLEISNPVVEILDADKQYVWYIDISSLIEVLKSMGSKALKSVQGELSKLEEELIALKKRLSALERQQEPVERVSEDAKAFLETWSNVGDVLDAATHDEQLQLLRHYIEVVELKADDSKGKTGTYAMVCFLKSAQIAASTGRKRGLKPFQGRQKHKTASIPRTEPTPQC